MAQNNNNQDYTNLSDGFSLGGGVTKRKVKVTGGDVDITGSGTNTYTFPSTTSTLATQASVDDSMPIGAGMEYWGTTVPSANWMFAYGQAISRTTYATLFARLGTAYGAGDGSTTFNLPDKRGRVTAGKDDMGGTSANRLTNQSGGLNGDTLGATGGAETHTLITSEIPGHSHTVSARLTGSFTGGAPDLPYVYGSGGNGSNVTYTTNVTGGGGAHNNVQPTIIANYIIKVA